MLAGDEDGRLWTWSVLDGVGQSRAAHSRAVTGVLANSNGKEVITASLGESAPHCRANTRWHYQSVGGVTLARGSVHYAAFGLNPAQPSAPVASAPPSAARWPLASFLLPIRPTSRCHARSSVLYRAWQQGQRAAGRDRMALRLARWRCGLRLQRQHAAVTTDRLGGPPASPSR